MSQLYTYTRSLLSLPPSPPIPPFLVISEHRAELLMSFDQRTSIWTSIFFSSTSLLYGIHDILDLSSYLILQVLGMSFGPFHWETVVKVKLWHSMCSSLLGCHCPLKWPIGEMYACLLTCLDFPGGSVVKNMSASAGDVGSILGSGSSPGEGNGNPLQYSCLGNPMDRGAWQVTVHGVAEELDVT